MAKCLQASSSVLIPILSELFQQMLQLGIHPASWKVARVLPIPKPGANLHSAKGYRPIALLNVLSKVMESLMKDRMSYILEIGHLLAIANKAFARPDLQSWPYGALSRAPLWP